MYEHKQLFSSMLERIQQVGVAHGLKPPQAFARWFAEMYFDQPADFIVTDGSGDAKVDLLFATSDGASITHHVLNTKFTEKYNSLAPVSFYNEITAFWQAFKNRTNRANYLEKMVRADLRPIYRKQFDYFDQGHAQLFFLTNCRRNDSQAQAVKNYDVQIFHLDDILQFMADYIENAMPHTRSLHLTGISNVLTADKKETEVPTSIVFARLTDFISYMKEDPYDLLFNRNVRLWLGKTKVNDEICGTFTTQPKEFAFSNNGITLLCEKHVVHQGRHEIEITNPRIVNGSQTLHSIRDATPNRASQLARVMVRIVEIPPLGAINLSERAEHRKQIIRKIALRSNSQNNIKKWDLVSNDDFQLELARHFRSKKLFYERRQKEWAARRTHLKSVGVKRGPQLKNLMQLIASYYWDDDFLGPVLAKNPAELFEDRRYSKITETSVETAYQLFLLGEILDVHVAELAKSKRFVGNFARYMTYALFSIIVRGLEKVGATWGTQQFSLALEQELKTSSTAWKKLVLQSINHIRRTYGSANNRYKMSKRAQLPIANFFKSQSYIDLLFPKSMSKDIQRLAKSAISHHSRR